MINTNTNGYRGEQGILTGKNNRGLLDELNRLAESGQTADFNFAPDIGNLSAGERETAELLKKVFDNCRASAKSDMMRYKLAGESLNSGHWDISITDGNVINPNNKLTWSSGLRRLLGYPDDPDAGDRVYTLENWLNYLHPDDKDSALKAFVAHAEDRTGKTQFITEYRLKKITGDYITVRVYGMAIRDSAGVPIRIAGAVEEITEAAMVRNKLLHREKTLDILNRVALVLLARKENTFSEAMSEGLGLIAEIADIDRMSVFRNSDKPDGLHASQIYRWRKDLNGTADVWEELNDIPYSKFSAQLGSMLASGECVSGHTNRLPVNEVFKQFGCVTVLLIPIFDDGKFWGVVFFERLTEKNFTDRETDVLRSASFMLANTVIRNEEAVIVRQANEQAKLMLDAAPLAVTMWDRNFNVIDCSQSAVDLFGFSSKQELVEHLMEYAPEYQPCGRRSSDMLTEAATEAFRTGRCRLDWTHTTTSGESIIFDAIAVLVKYGNDHALMLYSRDIREEMKMMAGLVERDKELAAQAHWYKALLDSVPLPISVTDTDMKVTFANAAAEKTFDINREKLIGLPCSAWDTPICGTTDCSVLRARKGQKQNYFKLGNRSCKIDTEFVHDMAGKHIGHIEILHDVTDVENLARRSAEAANEAKSAFLAQMSHEMRTPLSAVIGLSELVLENGGLNQENEVYLDKIYNAGSTLLSIVNDILDISKIEAGKFDIIPQEYDVPSLVNDTITQNILRIHSKPVQFILNINENVPARLRGDDLRVKQVISNLLSNAFKYTYKGTVELRIDHEREGDSVWIVFRISDTGVGVKPEDIKNIFADYTRFDGESNRKIGGTGLGLSITKRLVELMDGNITVESEYGKGSVFTAKIRQQFAGDAVIGSEMAEHLRNFLYTTSKRRSGAQLNRVSIPYAKVLVVDDNMTNLDIARGLMRPYGMDIDCVTGGQAAVDAIREGKDKYNAVFMDHMMPGMDGVEAVRIIRNEIGSEYAKTVPIIALTANALAGNNEWFINRGFNAFVSKPIDIFRLDSVIRKWIWNKSKVTPQDDSRVFVEKRKRPDRRKRGDRRTGERRYNVSPPAFTGDPEGLDLAKGTELFGGMDSFHEVLRSFAVNTRPLLESISEASEETLPQYAITVHGIKSSSRGICAQALGNMAESLEFAAKDGNLDFVSLHNPSFLKAVHKLIGDIETLLNKTAEATVKPRKDRPGDDELTRLAAACDNYDLDEIEAVMRELDGYVYTDDGGLTEWLRENIARLNYAQVVNRITQVVKKV